MSTKEERDYLLKIPKNKKALIKPFEPYSKLFKRGYSKTAKLYLSQRDKFKNFKYLKKLNSLLKPHSKILDIGCGAGVPIDKFLIQKGHQVIGIDFSKDQIRLARKNLPQCKFVVKDMLNLKNNEYKVDAVISFYAIFHIPREKHFELFQK